MKKITIFILLCLGFSIGMTAQDDSNSVKNPFRAIILTGDKVENPVRIPSRFHDERGNLIENISRSPCTTTNFDVTYGPGFTPEAQAAFQYAVDIWENIIQSDVTIKINATWQPAANPNNLGSAGAGFIWRNNPSFPLANTFYPDALADMLAGTDVNPTTTDFDINANFNSNRSDWYFGTDANPGINEFDLVTVVLHEIGHGLGFSGSVISDGTAAGTTIQTGSPANPIIWDTFIETGGGTPILNFTSGSTGLVNALTGGNLWFNGTLANAANGGSRVELFAPISWTQGSSYSHMDEATFPGGLMTPFLSAGEAIHDPGAIVLGILEDMGWEILDCSGNGGTYYVNKNLSSPIIGNKFRRLTVAANNIPDNSFLFIETTGDHNEITTPLIITTSMLIRPDFAPTESAVFK